MIILKICIWLNSDEKKLTSLSLDKKLEMEDEAYDPASAFDDESPPEDEAYDPFAEYKTSKEIAFCSLRV